MTYQERIFEQEAVALAGVSARTLLRFSESGYLTVETATDGTRLFQRSQLVEIFGLTASSTPAPATSPQPFTASSQNESSEPLDRTHVSVKSPVQQEISQAQPSSTPHEQRTAQTSNREESLETENQRLKNLLSIQERILDAKDDEIADLKNQRTWLRERIEKLEEKADRDQILLLSETQTIRKLIAIQEARKSPVRNLLEWIGVLPTPSEITAIPQQTNYPQGGASSASSRTIEVRAAANER